MTSVDPGARVAGEEVPVIGHKCIIPDDIDAPRRHPDVAWLLDDYRRRRRSTLHSRWSRLFLGLDGIADDGPADAANSSTDQRAPGGMTGRATNDRTGPRADGYPCHRPLLARPHRGRT